MLELLHSLEHILEIVVHYAIFMFTFIGVVIMIRTGLVAIWHFLKKEPHLALKLAEGMKLALEFKLGAEILHTVLISEPKELIIIGGIIVMRMALTWMIQWEIKKDKEEHISLMEMPKWKKGDHTEDEKKQETSSEV
ncbi:MAG: DUF1622 domain-containing protein [Anaerotignum sp.]|nr:DUF1622 domain-containing protein [Anaerotignum sp.]